MSTYQLPGDKLAESYLTEYKDLQAEIRLRIDLQHRNMNVLMVIVTAVTGYLVKYASDNGVSTKGTGLVYNDVVALTAVVPAITIIFLLRHLDHDENIIDKAAYISQRLRAVIERDFGWADVFRWEAFLSERRKARPRRLGPFLVLGKEDVPMFFVLAAYLIGAWYVRTIKGYAGGAHTVFDVLLYVTSGFALIALAMAIRIGLEYGKVGEVSPSLPPGHAVPPATGGGQPVVTQATTTAKVAKKVTAKKISPKKVP